MPIDHESIILLFSLRIEFGPPWQWTVDKSGCRVSKIKKLIYLLSPHFGFVRYE
jgi:hypothetical protein